MTSGYIYQQELGLNQKKERRQAGREKGKSRKAEKKDKERKEGKG